MTLRTPLLAALVLAAPLAHAQHVHPARAPAGESQAEAEATFLREVRDAIRPFADQRAASAAGFRPLGPDMPHMGQHWVHPGRAVSRDFDPAAPAMLTYLDVDGVPVLTGAAFTVPVAGGEAPPAFPYEGAWHAHAGRLMDEAFGLVPHGVRDEDRPRLAMLHAWTEAANPDGVWAADNWALPFVRRGLVVPEHVPPAAGRAVALVAGYAEFFREAIRRAAAPTEDEWRQIDDAFARHGAAIEALLNAGTEGEPPDVEALTRQWAALWSEIEQGGSERLIGALRPLFGADGHTGTHGIGGG